MVSILNTLQHYVPAVPANEVVNVPGSEPVNLVKNRIHRIAIGKESSLERHTVK